MNGHKLSIIIPILNEASTLPGLVEHLLPFQRNGCEILLVDGGSEDNSVNLAELAGFTVIPSPRGRALQMNTGAHESHGDVLLFLHADTRLPDNAHELIFQAVSGRCNAWGRFDVRIVGSSMMFAIIARCINIRSRVSGIATGDQGIFIKRTLFDRMGGFPDQPLMEDVEMSGRLKRQAWPVCLRQHVTTSGRRWERYGIWPTIFLMWKLRLAYRLGVSPERLARAYQ